MSSASERANARRKAILARGGDRLAKLTTSARGDEGSAFLQDEGSSFSKSFVGEDGNSDMPTMSKLSVSPSPAPTPRKSSNTGPTSSPTPPPIPQPQNTSNGVDESVWSTELQEQFRQALMNASDTSSPRSKPSSRVPSGTMPSSGSTFPDMSSADPLQQLMEAMQAQGGGGAGGAGLPPGFPPGFGGGGFPGFGQPPQPQAERTKAITALIQTILSWLLLVYFVYWAEPMAYVRQVGSLDVGRWSRWAMLADRNDSWDLLLTFRVQEVPFLWAFVALEIAFRFFTIKTTLDSSSGMMGMLNMIPGPIGVALTQARSIVSLVLILLNDLASIVFGLGVVIYLASWAK